MKMFGRIVKGALLKKTLLLLLISGCEILGAQKAWAVQAHGGAEGLVSHQIGHLFFLLGAGCLLWQVISRDLKGKGWSSFRAFLWLICLWNVLTFAGHWARETLDPSQFVREGRQIEAFIVSDGADILFYIANLDHLILIPALFCLAIALKKWKHSA
jgi:hypothetical protein